MPPKKEKKVVFKKRRRGARVAGKKSSKQKQKQRQVVNLSVSAGGSGGGGFVPIPQAPAIDYSLLSNLIRPAATQPVSLAQSVIQPSPDIAVRPSEQPTLVETALPKARRRIEGESDAEYSARMAKYYQKLEEASARQIEQRRKAALADIPQAFASAEAVPVFTESGRNSIFGLEPVSESEMEKPLPDAPKPRKPRTKKVEKVPVFTSGGEE